MKPYQFPGVNPQAEAKALAKAGKRRTPVKRAGKKVVAKGKGKAR